MGIQILQPTKRMIMRLTPLHPAEERPLLSRILATGSSMLSHGLLDFVLLSTMLTGENHIWCRLIRTKGDSCMLSQSLLCHILLTTLLTSELGPLGVTTPVSFNMQWLASSYEQLSQGNCSPLWTSMCFPNQ